MSDKPVRQVAFAASVDGPPPKENHLARLIAAAKAAGFGFSCDKPFLHYFEKRAGKPVRHEVWTMDGEQRLTLDGVEYSFVQFREKFEDDAWVGANRSSTIARLRIATEGLQFWMNGILAEVPHVMIRRGKAFALIHPSDTPERKADLLASLNGR